MNSDDLKLHSVNWEHGMLLTPDHFLRQERYFDSMVLWALRYLTSAYGLVGGGPRLAESERGAARYDPIVSLAEDEESLSISVSQCRAVTPAGCIIEITPSSSVNCRLPKAELEGVQEAPVYVIAEPHAKEAADGTRDEFNPQMQTERHAAYRIALVAPADRTPYAAVCAQIRRQRYGTGYEKNPDFIPACTTMTSHSELAAAFRKIVEEITFLAERYAELHRAMREYLLLFTERGIETEVDTQTVQFVDRIVMALQDCVYELLDSAQPPQRFFGQLRRFFHSAAVYFDLTPGMQTYYETLKEAGETAFIQLIEQQKRILKATRTWAVNEDLGVEARGALANLAALVKLEQALEGKYLDFRVSPALDAMNFVFDRGGNVLYKLAAKPSRVQGMGDELITFFSQLRLEGRDKYRLVLVGESGAVFEKGTRITAEIRINEGSGFQRAPLNLACEARMAGQVNFEFDFEAPDVPTITDLKVSVQAHHPIRTALLFSRHRFYAGRAQEAPQRVEPMQRAPEPPAPPPLAPEPPPPPRYQAPPPPPPPAQPAPPVVPEEQKRGAPWDIFRKTPQPPAPPPRPRIEPQQSDDQPPPPPRRRRLE
jgi:hypothetical protein